MMTLEGRLMSASISYKWTKEKTVTWVKNWIYRTLRQKREHWTKILIELQHISGDQKLHIMPYSLVSMESQLKAFYAEKSLIHEQ